MNETRATLESLIVSAHRLTRVAAQSTGDQTSPAVWRTLAILENDGPMRLGELALASRVAQPTMSKMVQNLVADEWVRRIADVDDSRSWLIAPSPKGQRALAAWRETVATAAAPLFDGLDASEWATLASAAAILRERLVGNRVAA
ncbi:MarR family winged helix-turn-helix transcriptional regulator [Amnibacterium flavum]|uniref:MarR family winged helix-turn-helix transcriptional regulator n=1 Tax=Amnibacterium flavum TaxID=2173173 RepID=UPI001403EA0C|nr:MarR family transcriptional regulator [Amnibacterium flavum]